MVRSLFGYPPIDDGSEYPDFEGKLFAAAFCGICSDYLVLTSQMYPHEDFEGFAEEMEFIEDEKELIDYATTKYQLQYDDGFDNLVFELIKKIREKIKSDIKSLFIARDIQLKLFDSIFNMGEGYEYIPSGECGMTTEFLH